mmetsp:Transcript_43081/g.97261  ORF Transcript_43081/g.97261 Transcript_43081/m.97261 type:complete len:181 (+) Transcript_43081:2-544(+)
MNMLIGILCEVISAVAHAEEEESAITMVKKTLLLMLMRLDRDGSRTLSEPEITNVIHDKLSLEVLFDLKVDVPYLMDMQHMIFRDIHTEMPIKMMMDLILACRGDRPAQMQDVMDAVHLINFTLSDEIQALQTWLDSNLPANSARIHDASAGAEMAALGAEKGSPSTVFDETEVGGSSLM